VEDASEMISASLCISVCKLFIKDDGIIQGAPSANSRYCRVFCSTGISPFYSSDYPPSEILY